jgi:2-dehydropantoate 2-reductase
MAELARETAAVAALRGITLPFPDPVTAAEEVARHTADNRSSMLQDVLRLAPTEIDAICGAIGIIGKSMGFPTPYNDCMYQLVKAITQTSSLP